MKTRWFMYTVLVGLIPVFCRLIVSFFSKNAGTYFWLNPSDFVALGLLLCITGLNEIHRVDWSPSDAQWKTAATGISIICIVIYGVLFAVSIIAEIVPDEIDRSNLNIAAPVFTFATFLFSASIMYRIGKSHPTEAQ